MLLLFCSGDKEAAFFKYATSGQFDYSEMRSFK